MKLQILAKLKDPRTNWKYILIVIILAFVAGGGILWYQTKTIREIEFLTHSLEIEGQKSYEIHPHVLKIPTSIALENKLLEKFLIEKKIGREVGFESSKIIRRDLDGDGAEEIVIGFNFGGPSQGIVGIIKKKGERYLLSEWQEVGLGVLNLEIKNIPTAEYQSLIVRTGGSAGTGLYFEEVKIFLIDELKGQFKKLIWNGLLKDFEISGSIGSRGIDATYNIVFEDVDNDGSTEIIQTGVEKEIQVTESFEYTTLKETPIKKFLNITVLSTFYSTFEN